MARTRLSWVAREGSWTAGGLLLLTSAYVFLRRRRHRLAPQPNEVASGVYCLVTGPRFLPSNVYFVRSGSSWALIDAGWSKCGPLIKETAEALFGVNTRPAAMLLTHVHPDHAGSALELAQMWELPVYMHPDEMPLTAGTLAALAGYPASPLDRWIVLPVMRALPRRRREAIMATGSLKERARPFDPRAGVPGLPDWECIPTPGHSPGHVSFFWPSDRVLITGDAVVTMKVNSVWGFLRHQQGLSGPPWYFTSSWRTAQESIAALAQLEPRVLATGHGSPMSGAGTARELRAFADHCRAPDPTTVEIVENYEPFRQLGGVGALLRYRHEAPPAAVH